MFQIIKWPSITSYLWSVVVTLFPLVRPNWKVKYTSNQLFWTAIFMLNAHFGCEIFIEIDSIALYFEEPENKRENEYECTIHCGLSQVLMVLMRLPIAYCSLHTSRLYRLPLIQIALTHVSSSKNWNTNICYWYPTIVSRITSIETNTHKFFFLWIDNVHKIDWKEYNEWQWNYRNSDSTNTINNKHDSMNEWI